MVKEMTYTERDGATPVDALDFLNWTQRDGATFDGPFKYDRPRTGGYPHSAGGSGFTGYWMSELGVQVMGPLQTGFVSHQMGVYIGADGTFDVFDDTQGWIGRIPGNTISGTIVGDEVTIIWSDGETSLPISGTIVGDEFTGAIGMGEEFSFPFVFKKIELEPAPIVTFDDDGYATLTPAPGATYTAMRYRTSNYDTEYDGPFFPNKEVVTAVGVKFGTFQEQEDVPYMVSDYAMVPVPENE